MDIGLYLIAAGASLVGGAISSGSSRSNAAATQAAANANYNTQIAAGQMSAELNSQIYRYNASLITQQATANQAALDQVARFNVSQIEATQAYNDSLLAYQDEAEWNVYELDSELMQDRFQRVQGSAIAMQAASGTVIGEGSNFDFVADIKTQHAMDQTILRHNADTVAADLLNARAQGEWQARAEAQKILYESEVNQAVLGINAGYQAQGTLMQGSLNNQISLINSQASAQTAYNQGTAQARSYSNQAGQQMLSSYISAAGLMGAGALSKPGTSLLI